ncbi:MAG: family 2 glycosyl transferase, partial [bacterium]|nr:family 2 glycosyl transferase [bacterium]
GVIGVAGCPITKGKSLILTTIVQGKNRDKVGNGLRDVTRVQTVDECFFIEKKSYYKEHRFSKNSGWHLYAVEQCLEAQLKGKNNYVIPANLWHISPGDSENINYVYSGINLIKKYGSEFESINTTVEKWYSRGAKKYYMPWLNFILHKLKRKLRKNTNLYKNIRKIYLRYKR